MLGVAVPGLWGSVSSFLLHFYAYAITCACSFSVCHALAHFRGSVWFSVIELELCVADGACCWVVGRADLLCVLGLGLAAPAPRFLGTQPPCVTHINIQISLQLTF